MRKFNSQIRKNKTQIRKFKVEKYDIFPNLELFGRLFVFFHGSSHETIRKWGKILKSLKLNKQKELFNVGKI